MKESESESVMMELQQGTPSSTSTTSTRTSLASPPPNIIQTLSRTTHEILLQSEISSILNTIVSDIETAHSLERKINHERELSEMKRRCQLAEEALEEYKALERQRIHESQVLGQRFLNDLWNMEEYMESGFDNLPRSAGGHNHDHEIGEQQPGGDKNDDLRKDGKDGANLETVQGNGNADANSNSNSNDIAHEPYTYETTEHTSAVHKQVYTPNTDTDTDTDTPTKDATPLVNDPEPEDDIATHESHEPITVANAENSSAGDAHTLIDDTTRTSTRTSTSTTPEDRDQTSNTEKEDTSKPKPSHATNTDVNASVAPQTASATQPQSQSNIHKKTKAATLQSINSQTLMCIFEYLEALDIVNTAQTNVKLYTRVNSIFGLGGTIVTDRSNDEDEQEEEHKDDEVVHRGDAQVELVDGSDGDDISDDNNNDDGINSGLSGTGTRTGTRALAKDEPVVVVMEEDEKDGAAVATVTATATATEDKQENGASSVTATAPQTTPHRTDSDLSDQSQNRGATIVSIPAPKSKGGNKTMQPRKDQNHIQTQAQAQAQAQATIAKPRSRTLSDASSATTVKDVPTISKPRSRCNTAEPSSRSTSFNDASQPGGKPRSNSTPDGTSSTATVTATAKPTEKIVNQPQPKVPRKPTMAKRSGYQISPAVAKSLASKLLPAELSAIISMRDELRKKEEELHAIKEDHDDLLAQFEGTISIKEVLTEKVKELQKTLQSDREIATKITRQTSSDQEVIAFLDERVQELEKATSDFNQEREKAKLSVEKVKEASERRVTVLTDMLTYEREERADHEKEWKSQKKVLVKEVKHCRAQIMALEAERGGFREENEKLKEAILSMGVGAGLLSNE